MQFHNFTNAHVQKGGKFFTRHDSQCVLCIHAKSMGKIDICIKVIRDEMLVFVKKTDSNRFAVNNIFVFLVSFDGCSYSIYLVIFNIQPLTTGSPVSSILIMRFFLIYHHITIIPHL